MRKENPGVQSGPPIFKKTINRPNASSDDSTESPESYEDDDDEEVIESMKKKNPELQSGPIIFKKTIPRPNASSDDSTECSESHDGVERESLEEYYDYRIEDDYSDESSGDESVEYPSEWINNGSNASSDDPAESSESYDDDDDEDVIESTKKENPELQSRTEEGEYSDESSGDESVEYPYNSIDTYSVVIE